MCKTFVRKKKECKAKSFTLLRAKVLHIRAQIENKSFTHTEARKGRGGNPPLPGLPTLRLADGLSGLLDGIHRRGQKANHVAKVTARNLRGLRSLAGTDPEGHDAVLHGDGATDGLSSRQLLLGFLGDAVGSNVGKSLDILPELGYRHGLGTTALASVRRKRHDRDTLGVEGHRHSLLDDGGGRLIGFVVEDAGGHALPLGFWLDAVVWAPSPHIPH